MNRLTSEEGQLYACGNGLCSDGDIECANCRYANEAFLKLAEYENVEEQGLLIKIKPIKDFENRYGVDEFGNVYSFNSIVKNSPTSLSGR